MRLVHLVQKTDILKYQTAEYNDPLDYMRAAMAAIRSGQPRMRKLPRVAPVISFR